MFRPPYVLSMQNKTVEGAQRQLSRNEKLKAAHPALAGNIAATLGDPTAESFSAEDCDAFHGWKPAG